jgi:hypothetical protein
MAAELQRFAVLIAPSSNAVLRKVKNKYEHLPFQVTLSDKWHVNDTKSNVIWHLIRVWERHMMEMRARRNFTLPRIQVILHEKWPLKF